MAKIAKKTRSVKGQKQAKPLPAPRFAIRKDSLNRRYAVEKRTGKRVSVVRAEKERKKRRKAVAKPVVPKPSIPRNIPKKAKKPKKTRSEAAKRGWETRRKKVAAEKVVQLRPIREEDILPIGVTMVPLHDSKPRVVERVRERAERYPKVRDAANLAWLKLQAEGYARAVALAEGSKPTPYVNARFDAEHGNGDAERIRFEEFAMAHGLEDIDDIIDRLTEDGEYTARELYSLYFSPEVA